LSLSPRTFWALALLTLAIIAAPVWIFTELPILDYPAHLVRVTLLSNLPLDPILARYWTVHLRPVANLGMDVFVPAVAPLTGPVAGLKFFATLGLALWIAGAGLLFRGFWGRHDAQALLAAPFAFNVPFSWGFFNFHFGAGLALVGAGFWAMRDRRSFLFLAAMAGLALVIFFCHMMALAVFALLLGGIELGRLFAVGFRLRRTIQVVCEGLAVFLPSVLVWAFWVEHGKGGDLLFDFLANIEAPVTVATALGASARYVSPILIMLAGLVAWRTGRLQVAPLGIGLLLITALATLLVPSEAFGGSNIELRMGAIFIVVGLTVLAVEWTRLIPWPRPSLICSFYFALLAALSALTIISWRAPVAAVAELRQMNATHLPYGARLATALADSDRDVRWHVADLAILDRKAFVPAFFATPGQSTVRLKQPFAAIGAVNADDGGAITVEEVKSLLDGEYDDLDPDDRVRLRPYRTLACDFDYLAIVGSRQKGLPADFIPVAVRPRATLYRIAPAPKRHCPPRKVQNQSKEAQSPQSTRSSHNRGRFHTTSTRSR
jgi:hypothetical protein